MNKLGTYGDRKLHGCHSNSHKLGTKSIERFALLCTAFTSTGIRNDVLFYYYGILSFLSLSMLLSTTRRIAGLCCEIYTQKDKHVSRGFHIQWCWKSEVPVFLDLETKPIKRMNADIRLRNNCEIRLLPPNNRFETGRHKHSLAFVSLCL